VPPSDPTKRAAVVKALEMARGDIEIADGEVAEPDVVDGAESMAE
jgi:hypothetical protein